MNRCAELDVELTRLAKQHGNTKFLRARADALGFAQLQSESERFDEDDDEGDEYYGNPVDKDMLPTMQVYKGGDLVFNWVRVDWEAGAAGIDEFLQRFILLN